MFIMMNWTVYCRDMWELGQAQMERVCARLMQRKKAEAHDTLSEEYGRVPQPMDLEAGSQIIGLNNRTKLPKHVGSAASLVEGLKFHRLGSQHAASADPSTSLQVHVLV